MIPLLSFSLPFEHIQDDFFSQSKHKMLFFMNKQKNRVIAMRRISPDFNAYLLASRAIDDQVLIKMQRVTDARQNYTALVQHQWIFFSSFGLLFILTTLLVWSVIMRYGMNLAIFFVEPLTRLIRGAQHVKSGDLNYFINENHIQIRELHDLIQAFNSAIASIQLHQNKLIEAQRQAAWSDVARRIAHEVKNPLTPIRLASERLLKRYGKYVPENEQISFHNYIEMITRHVHNIGEMINSFSNFARMPAPNKQSFDLKNLIQQSVLSQYALFPHIKFNVSSMINCHIHGDRGQLSQVLINLLKNAAESIDAYGKKHPQHLGSVDIEIVQQDSCVIIHIQDNGEGILDQNISNLFEPYVTTRSEGTGLGLSISQKIISDHDGSLTLTSRGVPEHGVCASIQLPCKINND